MKTSEAVSFLLDADNVSELFGKPVCLSHLRIKPEVALIAAVKDPRQGQVQGWVRLLWPVSHSKARKAQRIATSYGQHTAVANVNSELLADWGPVTADPALAAHIADYAVSSNTATNVGNTDLNADSFLRYNPLRRLVIRGHDNVTRIQAHTTPIVHRAIEHIGQSVPIPQPIETSLPQQSNVTQIEWCGDGDLSALTQHLTDSQAKQRAHAQAGEIFARLHSVPVPPQLAAALAQRAPQVHAQAAAHEGIFEHIDPYAAQRIRELGRQLKACEAYIKEKQTDGNEPGVVLSHGDASADQVLATSDFHQMWLTDFDRVCLATRATDLGSYISLCNAEENAAFLSGYVAGGGLLPSAEELKLAQARALISRLAENLKAGKLQWQRLTHQRLDTIQELLG